MGTLNIELNKINATSNSGYYGAKGNKSVALGESAALSNYSIAGGYNNTAGTKGYYYDNITSGKNNVCTGSSFSYQQTGTGAPSFISEISNTIIPEGSAITTTHWGEIESYYINLQYLDGQIIRLDNDVASRSIPAGTIVETLVYHTNVGATDGGVNISIDQSCSNLTIYQNQPCTIPADISTWQVGDRLSLINDRKYDDCCTITSINGNTIITTELPFTERIDMTGDNLSGDDYGIININRPEVGSYDFGLGAFVTGDNNLALNRGAIVAGTYNEAVGNYAAVFGAQNKGAYGSLVAGRGNYAAINSAALGTECNATIDFTYAIGNRLNVNKQHSAAFGRLNTVDALYSFACGDRNTITGDYSTVSGLLNKAAGKCSHAEGQNSEARGEGSFAGGLKSNATGVQSLAFGCDAQTLGAHSTATGFRTTAQGMRSSAAGEKTIAYGNHSVAEGLSSIQFANELAPQDGELTKDKLTVANWNSNKFLAAYGQASHAEGKNTFAFGNFSHTEGENTLAQGTHAHAEGYKNIASGQYAHVEGEEATAAGRSSHAEGGQTTAQGSHCHAEGYRTTAATHSGHAEGWCSIAGTKTKASNQNTHESVGATGYFTHAEGNHSIAYGTASHAEGKGTIANGMAQHVQGKFNVADAEGANAQYAHIVGGGTSNTDRKNIHTLDWNGNAYFKGGLTLGETTLTETELKSLKAGASNVEDITYVGVGESITFGSASTLPNGFITKVGGNSSEYGDVEVNLINVANYKHDDNDYSYQNASWDTDGTITLPSSGVVVGCVLFEGSVTLAQDATFTSTTGVCSNGESLDNQTPMYSLTVNGTTSFIGAGTSKSLSAGDVITRIDINCYTDMDTWTITKPSLMALENVDLVSIEHIFSARNTIACEGTASGLTISGFDGTSNGGTVTIKDNYIELYNTDGLGASFTGTYEICQDKVMDRDCKIIIRLYSIQTNTLNSSFTPVFVKNGDEIEYTTTIFIEDSSWVSGTLREYSITVTAGDVISLSLTGTCGIYDGQIRYYSEFEPYGLSVTLPEIPKLSLGIDNRYYNYIDFENNFAGILVDVIEFDGSEDEEWVNPNGDGIATSYYINSKFKSVVTKSLTSYWVQGNIGAGWDYGSYTVDNDGLTLQLSGEQETGGILASVEKFREALSVNPVKLLYVLPPEERQIIPLENVEPLAITLGASNTLKFANCPAVCTVKYQEKG